MRKHLFFVSIIFFAFTHLHAQTWNSPINVVGPYSGTGGRFGEFPKLLVVNGNPAMAAYDATRGNLLFIRATDASGISWAPSVPVDIGGVGYWLSMQIVNGNPAISYFDATNQDLKFVRATDANGTAWASPITLDVTGNVGQYTSLQIVNGNPAISYYDNTNQDLKYVRAADASGTTWAAPITIDATGNVGQWTSMQVVNGSPAISYYVSDPNNNNLRYVRATDASGTLWAAPITLDFSAFLTKGQNSSLQIVNGNPAISYYDGSNGDLKYIRATDLSGTVWALPVIVDATGSVGQYTSLQIVNGNPAISYYDDTNQDLKYVRATDASGTAWALPVIADPLSFWGYYTSMQVVNGNPAIAHFGAGDYFNLRYVRSSDGNGSSWGAVISFSVTGNIGQWCSLQIVNGNPAISFYNSTVSTYGHLQFVRATDASGTSWGSPIIADIAFGDVGKYSSLQMVNGNPAISYFANGDLKYARATDAFGTAWSTPVTLESIGLSSWEAFNSLQIVNGNPAVSYYSASGSLKYVRANDASGTSWSAPITLDATGLVGKYPSMQIVNGNPAISYYDYLGTKLKYIRATNVSGTAWSAPVSVDVIVGMGFYTSLQVINGNPAISYSSGNSLALKYVRATDASGTAWSAPLTIDATAFVGYHTSMQIVNGKPAISYYNLTNHDLKYIIATDASGTAWTTPVALDQPGDVGQYNSMQIVNGNPAISYYDATSGLLKYIYASSTASISTSLSITSTCIGSGFTVDYSSANATFNAGNVFTAQLSDAAGSFTSPVNIGTYNSTSASGTINVIVPSNTPSGNNYLIRVVSSDPVITGSASNSLIISSTNNWTGAVNTEWENPANWSCSLVPDVYTDVVISSGTVTVNSNGTCRTLTVMPGVNFTVNPGFNLTVLH